MTHPTPTAAPSAHRREGMRPGDFPLATLAARTMLGVFLFLMLLTAVPWFFTRGPDVAWGVVVSALPNLLILVAFAVLLPKGNRILAATFAIWCLWGLTGSFSGGSNLFVAMVGYAHGILNLVGIVGVVKGWQGKANA